MSDPPSAARNAFADASLPDISILDSLIHISATVPELDDLLHTALEILQQKFGFAGQVVFLVDDKTNTLTQTAQLGALTEARQETLESLVAKAIDTGTPVQGDVLPNLHPHETPLSCLVLPLMVGRLAIGALALAHTDAASFTGYHARLLKVFAGQLTAGITNAQLYKRTRIHQQQELIRRQIATHLQQLSSIINATLELDEVLTLILDHIKVVIPFTKAFIILLEGHHLVVRAAAGDNVEGLGGKVDIAQDILYQQILQQMYPSVFHDIAAKSHLTPTRTTLLKDTAAWIGAPLIVKKRFIGLLTLHHTQAGYFDDADLDLVNAFGNQAAIAIENAQLYTAEQQKAKQFQTVAKIGRQAAAIREVDALLNTGIHRLHHDLGYQYITIFLYDAPTEILHLKADSHLNRDDLSPEQRTISLHSAGVICTAAQTRQPILINDVAAYDGYFPGPGRETVQSELAIPLLTHGKLIGVLDLQADQMHAFLPDDLVLAQTVADQLAVAIETAHLFEESEKRLAEVSTLYTLAHHIASSMGTDHLLHDTVSLIKLAFDCAGCAALLWEDNRLVVGPQSKTTSPDTDAFLLACGNQLPESDAIEPLHFPTPADFPPDAVAPDDIQSVLLVPLRHQGDLLGALAVYHRHPHGFSADEAKLLMIVAAQVASAMANSQLIRQLQQDTASLEKTLNRFQELYRMQAEFVQNVSHELRNPLTFVRGYIDLILEGSMGPITPSTQKGLEIVSQRANDLDRMVSEMTSHQQLRISTLNQQAVNISQLIRLLVESAHPTARQMGITLHIDVPDSSPEIRADPDKIGQVVDNLLSNALKFTNSGGEVTVSAAIEGDQVRVSVQDTGIGIAPEEQEKIFARFYQAETTRHRSAAGSGLGLAIVKEIIEAHGGQVGLHSKPGQGSTFYFTLPLDAPTDKT